MYSMIVSDHSLDKTLVVMDTYNKMDKVCLVDVQA